MGAEQNNYLTMELVREELDAFLCCKKTAVKAFDVFLQRHQERIDADQRTQFHQEEIALAVQK